MKRKFFLIVLVSLLTSFAVNAQTLYFRGEAYSQRIMNYGYWSNWSNWQSCNISITIDLTTDKVVIYSNRTQIYQIYDYTGSYMDGTTQCVDYRFYDQDGDRGTMTLAIKSNGQSHLYIRFSNIQWVYVVRRM